MRLQKYMAECGVASRRECEKIIQSGRVKVNGDTVTQLGTQVEPSSDYVCLDGKPVSVCENKVYIMFNKPKGVVTTAKDQFGRICVTDYFKDMKERILPVGRLDYDTEGLLLLTNDGEFIYKLTHPRHMVDKVYIAEVFGIPDTNTIKSMQKPIFIDGRLTSGAEVRAVSGNVLEITIHEGRNRQVRRMCEAAGHPVKNLKRIAIGGLKLDLERTGEWRYLLDEEVNSLLVESVFDNFIGES